MRRVVTVFEGQRIEIPSDRGSRKAMEYLLGIEIGGERPFVLRRGSLYATGFVGAVDAGPLRVEILPKPLGIDTIESARRLLLSMLVWAGQGVRHAWLKSGSSVEKDADLLELVERHAARELLMRLELGPPRRYSEVEETSSVIKGRIDFSKQARRLPTEAHLTAIRYHPLTTDNPLCHLLKALVGYLRDRAKSYATRQQLDQCLSALGPGRPPYLSPELVARVRLGPLEQEWAPLVELARLLAGNETPNPTAIGTTAQSTVLFSLSTLFEQIVRGVLSAELQQQGTISCVRTATEHPLLRQGDRVSGEVQLAVRPDLCFLTGKVVVAPGDAKWKRLSQNEKRNGILPADVYQLMAYMRLFGSSTGLLFFPRTDWMPQGWQSRLNIERDPSGTIVVISVDVYALIGGSKTANKSEAERLSTQVRAALPQVVTSPLIAS